MSDEGAVASQPGAFGRLRRSEAFAGYMFLLPNFLGFLAFSLIPIFAAFALTFASWNLVGTPQFVGLSNYKQMVGDELFWTTARNTIYYTIGAVPIAVFIAFWLALLLNRAIRGVTFFRTLFFLPFVTLTVAIAIVWSWIYNPDIGLLNYLLGLVGIDGPKWLQSTTWAMPAIIIMSDWKGIGYPMLIFLAALQVPASTLHHRAHGVSCNLLRPGDLFYRGNARVRPVLRDDGGRSSLLHYHDRHVHLSARLPVVRHGLRGHPCGRALPGHLRFYRRAVAFWEVLGLWLHF